MTTRRIIVGVSGATGVVYAVSEEIQQRVIANWQAYDYGSAP